MTLKWNTIEEATFRGFDKRAVMGPDRIDLEDMPERMRKRPIFAWRASERVFLPKCISHIFSNKGIDILFSL